MSYRSTVLASLLEWNPAWIVILHLSEDCTLSQYNCIWVPLLLLGVRWESWNFDWVNMVAHHLLVWKVMRDRRTESKDLTELSGVFCVATTSAVLQLCLKAYCFVAGNCFNMSDWQYLVTGIILGKWRAAYTDHSNLCAHGSTSD